MLIDFPYELESEINFNKFYLFIFRVQNLKDTIERLHGIPAANQVLLISGGEVLHLNSRVCSYSSGTDENPIYMFSTLFDSPKLLPPWPSESRKYLIFRSLFFRIIKTKLMLLLSLSFR